MHTSQTQFLSEVAEGPDGPPIPLSKLVYFQERFRGRVFDFLLRTFLREKENGLTQAKLARRIGKSPEVINRWLGSPTNLTLDSVSDLLIGIAGEELMPQSASVLGRVDSHHSGLDWSIGHEQEVPNQPTEAKPTSAWEAGGHLKIGLLDSVAFKAQRTLKDRTRAPRASEGRVAA
jgi:hypothetical protein